jgi:hypothetical protein
VRGFFMFDGRAMMRPSSEVDRFKWSRAAAISTARCPRLSAPGRG